MLDGLVVLPEAASRTTARGQVAALALPKSDLAGDGQRLGLATMALSYCPRCRSGWGCSTSLPSASPVSDLAGDGQRLVVVLDGLVVLPEVAVGDAEENADDDEDAVAGV